MRMTPLGPLLNIIIQNSLSQYNAPCYQTLFMDHSYSPSLPVTETRPLTRVTGRNNPASRHTRYAQTLYLERDMMTLHDLRNAATLHHKNIFEDGGAELRTSPLKRRGAVFLDFPPHVFQSFQYPSKKEKKKMSCYDYKFACQSRYESPHSRLLDERQRIPHSKPHKSTLLESRGVSAQDLIPLVHSLHLGRM